MFRYNSEASNGECPVLNQKDLSAEDNTREWAGLEFYQRAEENTEKWRKLVAKSSVVPERPPAVKGLDEMSCESAVK